VSCVQCGRDVQPAFRYCPWCGATQRRKLVEFFLGREGRALRVSRYLPTLDQEPQVRVSVWNERGEAQAAVSLDEREAERLATFLHPKRAPRSAVSRLREAAGIRRPTR
jgi:uncharacterized OB-fold protein